jgi:RecA-family ATPase
LLNASTNVRKSTLILNVALSAASNRNFEPLVTDETVGRKILYIDGEATKAELQADINKMAESLDPDERPLLENNLCLICDEDLDGEPLDLVKDDHRKKVLEVAERFKPDLIVIDTLSALALLEDENDNAKVAMEILRPLKSLATKTNAGVLVLHHVGKVNENPKFKISDSYKGRGASAFGALARSTFYIKEITSKRVELSCPKVKRSKFDSVILELNREARWFSNVGIASTTKKTNYDEVVEIVREFKDEAVKRSRIEEILKEREIKIAEQTLTKILKKAVENGDLLNPKHGHYSVPINPEEEMPLAE